MTKLGYLGPPGTFSELAASQWAASQTTAPSLSPEQSFFLLFDQLHSRQLDTIIVPIENSIEGAVSTTVDLITRYEDMTIIDEVLLPVSHSLMVLSDVKPSQIQAIMSHPQPLAQCQGYLSKHYPNAKQLATTSTALAAKKLTSQSNFETISTKNIGIIGHQNLANTYHLSVLDSDINDTKTNVTRFIVVSHQPGQKSKQNKTSIVVSPAQNEPGSLLRLLQIFSDKNINLTKIESRPTKALLGDYLFYIDFEGHKDDDMIKQILLELRQQTSYFRWLGSYPKA